MQGLAELRSDAARIGYYAIGRLAVDWCDYRPDCKAEASSRPEFVYHVTEGTNTT
jgi:hypothetical protein